jgi:uncharacterized membrane protein
MKNVSTSAPEAKRRGVGMFLAVVGVFLLMVACGTGVAAFAGLLPASKNVARVVTATPLIDVEVDAALSAQRHHAVGSSRHALPHEAA